ncbi:MAG: hypothetical protein LBC59_02645 [Chitinispirillales bacterium]|jgi:hypothetical protein|nr:hypothetical protein [Chitinispirillales bacterium]
MARKMYKDIIEKELDNVLAKYVVYEDMPPTHAQYLYDKFIERAKSAYLVRVSKNYPKGSQLCSRSKDVYTLVEQVWKRKVYFRVFHKDVDGMNELKETALYCFWVLKLQPFYIYGNSNSMNKLNAQMALNILIAGALAYINDMNDKHKERARLAKHAKTQKLSLNINKSIFDDLFYSFQFRDWSKEALMDLCAGLIIAKDEEI